MNVIGVMEIVGRSVSGSDDAVRRALETARKRGLPIKGLEVVSIRLGGDSVDEWQATVRVAHVSAVSALPEKDGGRNEARKRARRH
jgi:flavin-binding protein dodecin